MAEREARPSGLYLKVAVCLEARGSRWRGSWGLILTPTCVTSITLRPGPIGHWLWGVGVLFGVRVDLKWHLQQFLLKCFCYFLWTASSPSDSFIHLCTLRESAVIGSSGVPGVGCHESHCLHSLLPSYCSVCFVLRPLRVHLELGQLF